MESKNENKRKRKRKRKNEKEYIWVTLLVELSQAIWPEACWHKSVIPSQFKVPFDSNELYQSIKICSSLGSVDWPISNKIK